MPRSARPPSSQLIMLGMCRHPLDQQNTSLMQALPGMDFVAKSLMGEWV